jgi:anti-sigma-K factor RskA
MVHRFGSAALHTLAGAYALDALEHTDRVRFERHLTRCEACAQEVRGLRETTAVLGFAVSGAPPRQLRQRVLLTAAQTRQYPPATADHQRAVGGWMRWLRWLRWMGWRALPRFARRTSRLAVAFAAMAAAAAFVLATLSITMQHRLDRADEGSREVAAVLTARDATMMTAPVSTGGRATLVMSHAKRMVVFSAADLRALPAAKRYELWLMGPAGVRSAGMLPRPSDGMTAPVVVSGLAAGDKIGLTVEARSGSPHPTTPPVLMVALPS